MNTKNFYKLKRAEKCLNNAIELLETIPEIKAEGVFLDRLQVIQTGLLDEIIDFRKKIKGAKNNGKQK